MPVLKFNLELVSPTFLYGAFQRPPDVRPELRAMSVRGQLRYWLRALLGATTNDLNRIWETESAVFGSTGGGSTVSIRVYTTNPKATTRVPMLPHREGGGRSHSPTEALSAGQRASIELVTRPGIALPGWALASLQVWSLLGGIGKRSRRMFGAVRLVTKQEEVEWYSYPQSPDELIAVIQNILPSILPLHVTSGLYKQSVPAFPTLHPDHSWVVVGQEGFSDALEANRALFSLLRSAPFRSKERTFGYASGGRRASPVIAQVRRVNGEFFPVITALRSKPDRDVDWSHLKNFMQTFEKDFNGVRVWGGW
jgi:CRISPR type III-B/RAMP module RAMP protein Cmr1